MSIAATTCRWRRISICLSGARKSFPRWGDPDRSSADAHRRQDHGLSGQRLRRPQQFPGRRQREDPQRHPPSGIVGRRRALSGTAPVISPGGGCAYPTGASHRLTPRRPGKCSATGRCHQARSRFIAGWRLAPYPAYRSSHRITPPRPGKRSATGRCIRHGAALLPGGGYALPGLPGPLTRSHLVGPVSAAPPGDAIRHGALYAGWRLAPYPAYRSLTGSHLVGPVNAAPPGDAIRHRAALLPGGGWRLTRPTGASHTITPRRPGKRSATGRCHQARSRFYAGWRLAPYPAYGPRHVSPSPRRERDCLRRWRRQPRHLRAQAQRRAAKLST